MNQPLTLRRSLLTLILPLGFMTSSASGGGIPVSDGLNLNQNIVTAANNVRQVLQQVQQYRIQLEQYKMQLQELESWGEADYTWEDVQSVLDNLNDITNKIEYFDDEVRSIDDYLERYQDIKYYEQSPCFTGQGCSDEQRRNIENNERRASRIQKEANKAMLEMVHAQKEQLKNDAQSIEEERIRATSATDQKAILAHANQFALEQTKQLIQIRELLVAQQEAINAEILKKSDKEAKETVYSKSYFDMSSPVDMQRDKGIPLTPLPKKR